MFPIALYLLSERASFLSFFLQMLVVFVVAWLRGNGKQSDLS